MSQKSRQKNSKESSVNTSSTALLSNNTPSDVTSILTPVILVTSQQQQQISPTASTSSSQNQSLNTNNLTNSTLPLPNVNSFNSSLTNSISSSLIHSSSSSSSTSSINNLNQITLNNNNNNNNNKKSNTQLITSLNQSMNTSNLNSSSSNRNQTQIIENQQAIIKQTNPIKQEIINNNNNNNYLQNDASNNLLCKNNNSVSNSSSNLSAALSETKKQNSITISLNYYNDQQQGNGHFFTKKTFHKPTYCHHCTEMLWGLMSQGFVCEVCNFVSHDKCQKLVISPCSSIAHSLVKNPVPHCWSEPTHFKKKFCNVCRKRLDDQFAIRCEICEYYAHIDCQVLAVNDCCETATFVPNRNLNSVNHYHHWREGNLPSSSKCSVCKKSCSTYECLAGMKCEWCSLTAHSICRSKIEEECNFGNLRDIIIPPFAVSVPRIDMNKEAILGIPTNRSKGRSNSNEWGGAIDFKIDQSENTNSLILNNHPNNSITINNNNNNSNNENNLNDNGNLLIPSSNLSIINSNSNANISMSLSTQAQLVANTTTTTLSVLTSPSTSSSSPSPISFGNNQQNNSNSFSTAQLISSPATTTTTASSKSNNTSQQTSTSNTSNVTSTTTTTSTSSGGSSKKKDKNKQLDEEEDCKEIIKVYDGNAAFRKRLFKTITVNKNSSHIAIVEASLRTFHINDDPTRYYITVPLSASNITSSPATSNCLDDYQIEELIVDETNPIKSIKSALFNSNNLDGPRPSILLRYKDSENESIRIYPGIINETSCYQRVMINVKSTALDTIQMALEKFQINKKNLVDKYSLVEVLLDHNVNERILNSNELTLQVIRKIRKESLCNHRMVRFYLQQKEDPHGPSVALFVGNLPSSLSQIQYEKILMDTFKNNNEIRWNKFDVIYYEYGSMVILYDDSEKAVKAYKMLKDSTYENKQLTVLLLPTIQHQMIPPNVFPLLVFVNVKSGGKQGLDLITSFRHLLNPHQVFDLQNGGPLPGLYVFRNIESYRILACGGDGTIGWVLSCLDNVSQDAKCQSPPMAIVPLGTGNDLARVLRWGAGYTGAEEPMNLLRDVIDAEEISLDRWTVVFHPDENKELEDIKKQLQIAVNVNQANTNEDNTEIYVMNNYFGIGIDADVCLDFHTAREENPSKFNSRLHNKKFYIQMGIRKMMNKGSCKEFNRYVTLEVDGRKIDLPQIEGIVILNILSWCSGANPWGPEKDDLFQKPTHYDGMLEVIGIRSVVHLGQIGGGLSNAIRLAQGGRIKIRMNTDIPVQVDGEPWLQSPCAITILKSALKATMLKKSKIKMKRRNTEPNINAPIAPNNSSESSGHRPEIDRVDPEGESEPY